MEIREELASVGSTWSSDTISGYKGVGCSAWVIFGLPTSQGKQTLTIDTQAA